MKRLLLFFAVALVTAMVSGCGDGEDDFVSNGKCYSVQVQKIIDDQIIWGFFMAEPGDPTFNKSGSQSKMIPVSFNCSDVKNVNIFEGLILDVKIISYEYIHFTGPLTTDKLPYVYSLRVKTCK